MVTAVYTDASRAATGMEEVLQMMMVRSIRERPVRGSTSSGNSFSTSTTSPARSPQAATMTMSTSAFLASMCCSTVLPAPKGPGTQKVPPLATGRNVSMERSLVTKVSSGRRRSS